jgi:hypothetical protein
MLLLAGDRKSFVTLQSLRKVSQALSRSQERYNKRRCWNCVVG